MAAASPATPELPPAHGPHIPGLNFPAGPGPARDLLRGVHTKALLSWDLGDCPRPQPSAPPRQEFSFPERNSPCPMWIQVSQSRGSLRSWQQSVPNPHSRGNVGSGRVMWGAPQHPGGRGASPTLQPHSLWEKEIPFHSCSPPARISKEESLVIASWFGFGFFFGVFFQCPKGNVGFY